MATIESTMPAKETKKPASTSTVRSIMTVAGLTSFFLLVIIGVLIVQRQRLDPSITAPNAPESNPQAAATPANNCSLSFTLTPPPTPTPSVSPSPSPTYACNSLCKTDAQCQTANSNYICYLSPTNDQDVASGRCRLKANPTSTQCLAPSPSPSPSPTPTPTPTPTPSPTPSVSPTPTPSVSPSPTPTGYSCNGSCSTDAQCQTVNAGYICHPDLKVCRLDTNRSNASCQPQTNTYACNSTCTTNAQCQTANGNYICSNSQCRLSSNPSASNCLPSNYVPPSPTIGCNQVCTSNADCSNTGHICSTTSDGTNRCRLADYVNSDSCTKPPQTSNTPAQPELPPELPQTGAFDSIGLWLKAGLAALGIGAALLLLL